MELLSDPVMLGVLKIVGIGIAFLAGIPFLVGLVLGYMLGHR